jgi:uroporphyrinogen-III synthase
MNDKINILSTKTLSLSQILIMDALKFNLTSVDFIAIKPIEFDYEKLKSSPLNWIITSKNSLKILFNLFSFETLKYINFYCVGDNTSQIIKDKKLNLAESKSTSKELGESILLNSQTSSFSFIAGSSRRNELPSILTNNNINFKEFIVYETVLKAQKIEEKLDAILFFSPSGIKGYLLNNSITNEQLFCIGQTTATEAKKYSTNINIAAEQTFEAVLEHTKQYYA